MGSKVRYSLTNNAVLLSDNNGIINVNYAYSSYAGSQMLVKKKMYFNEKYCYEFTINSSDSNNSNTYSFLLGRYMCNSLDKPSFGFELGQGLYMSPPSGYASYEEDKSQGGVLPIGSTLAILDDLSNGNMYIYSNGSLLYSYTVSNRSWFNTAKANSSYVTLCNRAHLCTSNVSINFGENGLKYSYPGYTSVYDAKEYLSIKDLEKMKKMKQY